MLSLTRAHVSTLSQTQEFASPLDPLLHRLSEEFIDDRDLSARLQRLFKARKRRVGRLVADA